MRSPHSPGTIISTAKNKTKDEGRKIMDIINEILENMKDDNEVINEILESMKS